MSWLEAKYISLLSTRLRNFKRTNNTYNFSCPICGDSETNKRKARGYIYEKKGKLAFYCHNCSASSSVPNFIKTIDNNLYNEYVIEKLQNNKTPEQIEFEEFTNKMKKPVFMKQGPLKGLKKVSQLNPDNPIKQFVMDREIPNEYHAKLFYCPNFMHYCNTIIPNKFSDRSLAFDEARLLIPFFNRDKSVFAFQGRSIKRNSQVKYITIVLDESVPKLFNLDVINYNKTIYVLEGPIDAMFIGNSVATAGGDMVSSVKSLPKDNLVIVYDNEPRNKETVKKIEKAIINGYKVCIWPDNMNKKDINEMVLNGLTSEFIKYIIDQNTFRDLAAMMRLKQWSKL